MSDAKAPKSELDLLRIRDRMYRYFRCGAKIGTFMRLKRDVTRLLDPQAAYKIENDAQFDEHDKRYRPNCLCPGEVVPPKNELQSMAFA